VGTSAFLGHDTLQKSLTPVFFRLLLRVCDARLVEERCWSTDPDYIATEWMDDHSLFRFMGKVPLFFVSLATE